MSIENLIIIILACRGNQLALSSEISTNLHLTRLRWVRNTEGAYRDSLLWYTHELVTKERGFFYLIRQFEISWYDIMYIIKREQSQSSRFL